MRSPTEFVRTASPEALFAIAGISQYTGAVVAVNLFEEVRPATVAWLRVLSAAIGYGIDQVVMRRIPVRRFAVLLALLPVSAMALGFIALGQRPSMADLFGAALVIAGVLLQERDELAPTLDEVPG